MPQATDELEPYLSTAAQMLATEGMHPAADLLRRAEPRLEPTGFDNWNGGTTIWTIYLEIDPSFFAQLGERRSALQDQINKRIDALLGDQIGHSYSVEIRPKVEHQEGWRDVRQGISEVARRNIVDGLRIDQVAWWGRLDEVEFLARLYDLKGLPSNDRRFGDASSDIWQHRVNNQDWTDDWVYSDSRFDLLSGPPDTFLRFLCELVHPVVRPDRDEQLRLVQQFNDQLRIEGWSLVEEEKIAGRPRFVARRLGLTGGRSVNRARSVADALDAAWMQQAISRLENAVEHDPDLAIGTAKELVESCCKTILAKRGVPYSKSADLPELTKALSKELKLVPDGIPDEAKGAETVRLILRNLTSMTQYIAELRGLYGTGHGRDGRHRGLEPRHARLVVGAAVAFIDFMTETHHRRT